MNEVAKMIWSALGAAVGWIVGEFSPTFPLVVVMVVFICADAWTAWQLDKANSNWSRMSSKIYPISEYSWQNLDVKNYLGL